VIDTHPGWAATSWTVVTSPLGSASQNSATPSFSETAQAGVARMAARAACGPEHSCGSISLRQVNLARAAPVPIRRSVRRRASARVLSTLPFS
jgi:hypothetical protein